MRENTHTANGLPPLAGFGAVARLCPNLPPPCGEAECSEARNARRRIGWGLLACIQGEFSGWYRACRMRAAKPTSPLARLEPRAAAELTRRRKREISCRAAKPVPPVFNRPEERGNWHDENVPCASMEKRSKLRR